MLDDSLSSVDAETERLILANLRGVMHGRTAVLISHRVAAIKDADQILVLDQGKIVERGTHDELIDAGGVYSELYRTQLDTEMRDRRRRPRSGASRSRRRASVPVSRPRRVLGKAYDVRLIRRVSKYVRPHWQPARSAWVAVHARSRSRSSSRSRTS